MMNKTENLCCKEGNDIPRELFKGISLCQLVLMSITADSGGISWTPTTFQMDSFVTLVNG